MDTITQETRYKQSLLQYAKKYGVEKRQGAWQSDWQKAYNNKWHPRYLPPLLPSVYFQSSDNQRVRTPYRIKPAYNIQISSTSEVKDTLTYLHFRIPILWVPHDRHVHFTGYINRSASAGLFACYTAFFIVLQCFITLLAYFITNKNPLSNDWSSLSNDYPLLSNDYPMIKR